MTRGPRVPPKCPTAFLFAYPLRELRIDGEDGKEMREEEGETEEGEERGRVVRKEEEGESGSRTYTSKSGTCRCNQRLRYLPRHPRPRKKIVGDQGS
jgi:hypothetical protein